MVAYGCVLLCKQVDTVFFALVNRCTTSHSGVDGAAVWNCKVPLSRKNTLHACRWPWIRLAVVKQKYFTLCPYFPQPLPSCLCRLLTTQTAHLTTPDGQVTMKSNRQTINSHTAARPLTAYAPLSCPVHLWKTKNQYCILYMDTKLFWPKNRHFTHKNGVFQTEQQCDFPMRRFPLSAVWFYIQKCNRFCGL